MPKGIELATGYISLTVHIDEKKTERQARDAGTRMGTRWADALRGKLASTSVVQKAMADTTKGAGTGAAKKFFQEYTTTSQRLMGATFIAIGKTMGAGIKAGLRSVEIAGNMFDRLKVTGVGMAKNVGGMIGRTLAATIRTALAGIGIGGAGAIGSILFSGFNRLKEIDSAKAKLRALGNDAGKVSQIMDSATKAVEGNQFALNDAATAAASAVAAGVKPGDELTKYLTDIADAASVAGVGFEEMGRIFNKVTTGGKAFTGELNQIADRGIPIFQWLQDEYGVTGEELSKMVKKGEIDAATFQRVLHDHIGGAGVGAADSLEGSVSKMKASLAKLGAEFITAALGGTDGNAIDTVKGAVDTLRGKLDELRNWVKAHQTDIRDFFVSAKDAAGKVVEVLRDIGGFLKEHPGLIKNVAEAFVVWKSIQGVAALSSALSAVSTLLKVTLPADAAVGAAGISKALGAIAIPAALLSILQWERDHERQQAMEDGKTEMAPIGPHGMMVPVAPGVGPIAGGGGPNASRERRGLPPVDPTGGLLGGTTGLPYGVGGGGRGYMNYGRTSAYLDQLSDQRLLSAVPAGRYTQTQGADLTQGLADCSSAVEDLVNIMDGRSTAGRSMATGNAAEWLTARGFRPGTAPGAFNVGFNNHHMQATLPGGTPFNWGSDAAAANRGIGGSGAYDPALTQRYYRYDQGGHLPPGTTLVQNDTGKPELILNPDQQKNLADAGVDPQSLMHGTGGGAAPGPQPVSATLTAGGDAEQPPDYGMDFLRSMGFKPAAASSGGEAGTSSLAGFINMGNSVVSGVIDTGVNLAQTAATAAIGAGTMGAGAAAGPAASMAASYGIQLAGNTAKRVSQYGFQMLGIGADALMEQAFPFGAPRSLGYDYTQFLPQLGLQQAATGTLEKMGTDAINKAMPQPGGTPAAPGGPAGPVSPSTMPGAPPPPKPDPEAGPNLTPALGPTTSAPDPLKELGLYDNGGMLFPGQVGFNASRTPERIFTEKQWGAMKAVAANPSSSSGATYNVYASDTDDAIRQLRRKESRDAMQYTGRP